MTDSDDKLSRRYRELPRAEPSAELDAAILAASRRAAGARPRSRSSWMVPTSIAAVLVLGIGVSLRMQLEQPGIETSVPERAERPEASSAAQAPQASPAPATPSAPAPKELARAESAPREERVRSPAPERKATTPLAKERIAPVEPPPPAAARSEAAEAKPFPDAQVAKEPATPSPAPTQSAASPAPVAAAPQAAPRARREAFAADSAAHESRALGVAADPDPARELERIARLREAARHEEADRALAEFRRRHPEYRIPEAMWERVKPR